MLDKAADDTMLVRLPRALCAAWKGAPLCAVLRKVPVRTYGTLYISRCLQRGSNNPQQVLHLPTSLPWPRAWCCSLVVHSFSAAACNETFHSRHERFVDLPSFEQRHASSLEPPRAVQTEPLCAHRVLVLPIAAAATTMAGLYSPHLPRCWGGSPPQSTWTRMTLFVSSREHVYPGASLRPIPETKCPTRIGHVTYLPWTTGTPRSRTRACVRGLGIKASNKDPPSLCRQGA